MYIPDTRGIPKNTLNKAFWSAINSSYITDLVRKECKERFGNDYAMCSHYFDVNQRRLYWIIEKRKDISCLTWKELNNLLDKLGYKVQFRIVSK